MPPAFLDPIEALPPTTDPRFARLLGATAELLLPNGDDPYIRDGAQRALAGLILLLVSRAETERGRENIPIRRHGGKPSLATLSDSIARLRHQPSLERLAGEAKTLPRAERAFLEIRRLFLIPADERTHILDEIDRRLGASPGIPPSPYSEKRRT